MKAIQKLFSHLIYALKFRQTNFGADLIMLAFVLVKRPNRATFNRSFAKPETKGIVIQYLNSPHGFMSN